MKTASFFTYTGEGRVSISRFPPRNTPAGFRVFRALAPGAWFRTTNRGEYEELYALQLANLDPATVWADLHKMAGDAEPVLLCFERPPFTETNWCHRRLAAAWLTDALGHEIPELEHVAPALEPFIQGSLI
jgi:hypothetical protein